jgi:release factor glutamine methyltransferase
MVVATDSSEPAIAVARRNIERLGLTERVTLATGELVEPLSPLVDREPFDLIVSNPPYIPSGQIDALDRSVRAYEPRVALDGGIDGLAFHRRILDDAPARVVSGGRVFLEIAYDQGPAALEVARSRDAFHEARIIKDNAGNDRVLALRKK